MSNKVWDKISYAQSADANQRLYERRVEQCSFYMLEQDMKTEQIKAAEKYNNRQLKLHSPNEAP